MVRWFSMTRMGSVPRFCWYVATIIMYEAARRQDLATLPSSLQHWTNMLLQTDHEVSQKEFLDLAVWYEAPHGSESVTCLPEDTQDVRALRLMYLYFTFVWERSVGQGTANLNSTAFGPAKAHYQQIVRMVNSTWAGYGTAALDFVTGGVRHRFTWTQSKIRDCLELNTTFKRSLSTGEYHRLMVGHFDSVKTPNVWRDKSSIDKFFNRWLPDAISAGAGAPNAASTVKQLLVDFEALVKMHGKFLLDQLELKNCTFVTSLKIPPHFVNVINAFDLDFAKRYKDYVQMHFSMNMKSMTSGCKENAPCGFGNEPCAFCVKDRAVNAKSCKEWVTKKNDFLKSASCTEWLKHKNLSLQSRWETVEVELEQDAENHGYYLRHFQDLTYTRYHEMAAKNDMGRKMLELAMSLARMANFRSVVFGPLWWNYLNLPETLQLTVGAPLEQGKVKTEKYTTTSVWNDLPICSDHSFTLLHNESESEPQQRCGPHPDLRKDHDPGCYVIETERVCNSNKLCAWSTPPKGIIGRLSNWLSVVGSVFKPLSTITRKYQTQRDVVESLSSLLFRRVVDLASTNTELLERLNLFIATMGIAAGSHTNMFSMESTNLPVQEQAEVPNQDAEIDRFQNTFEKVMIVNEFVEKGIAFLQFVYQFSGFVISDSVSSVLNTYFGLGGTMVTFTIMFCLQVYSTGDAFLAARRAMVGFGVLCTKAFSEFKAAVQGSAMTMAMYGGLVYLITMAGILGAGVPPIGPMILAVLLTRILIGRSKTAFTVFDPSHMYTGALQGIWDTQRVSFTTSLLPVHRGRRQTLYQWLDTEFCIATSRDGSMQYLLKEDEKDYYTMSQGHCNLCDCENEAFAAERTIVFKKMNDASMFESVDCGWRATFGEASESQDHAGDDWDTIMFPSEDAPYSCGVGWKHFSVYKPAGKQVFENVALFGVRAFSNLIDITDVNGTRLYTDSEYKTGFKRLFPGSFRIHIPPSVRLTSKRGDSRFLPLHGYRDVGHFRNMTNFIVKHSNLTKELRNNLDVGLYMVKPETLNLVWVLTDYKYTALGGGNFPTFVSSWSTWSSNGGWVYACPETHDIKKNLIGTKDCSYAGVLYGKTSRKQKTSSLWETCEDA
eukprot:TRINITY_DN31800_c0_g1_i1.p1 TRINITY_DN31800_c0_g1~~TRINITY_DN31800_c0_g1_i1.p1  ORF type:complete len:1131 (-),score=94.93 TRINITY_DN31800_c0_g1_i1:142-3480(-)